MIICLCHSIKDKDIHNHCKNHSNPTTTDIVQELHIGTDCGSCIPILNELILSYQNPATTKKSNDSNPLKIPSDFSKN